MNFSDAINWVELLAYLSATIYFFYGVLIKK